MKIKEISYIKAFKNKIICKECSKGRYAEIEYQFKGMKEPLQVCHFCAENIHRRTGDIFPILRSSKGGTRYEGEI